MRSSFKFITAKNSPILNEWYVNRNSAYSNAPLGAKLFFLLNQSIILNYLDRAYATITSESSEWVYNTNILYLITEYKNNFIVPEIEAIKNSLQSLSQPKFIEQIVEQLELLNMPSSLRVDAELCISLLNEYYTDTVPCAFEPHDASFYKPYLRFLEKAVSTETLLDTNIVDRAHSFSVTGVEVTIPSFSASADNLLIVSYDQRFTGYEYNALKHIELDKTLNVGTSSIFSYLYGYNWSTWTFNGFLGVLASMCLELDATAIPSNSLMWVYYLLYRTVFKWNPRATTRSNSLALSSSINSARRCTLAFVAAVRDRYGVEIDDTDLLSNLLSNGNNTRDTDTLKEYLNVKDASDISVEMYTAFKRSTFGTFEELDFRKRKKQSLDELIALQARSDKEVSPTTPGMEDSTFSLSSVLTGNVDRRSKAKNAAGDKYYDVDAEQADADKKAEGDEPADPEEVTKPENPDSDDANPTEDPSTMPGGDTDEMDDNEDTHTQRPLPRVSDIRGVRIDFSEKESTDTVLYRFELKAYVDSLLANPPKYLDVQTITYLKKLKAFWWNCLSVQTLYDVLNSMVKVPKAYRIKPARIKQQ